MIHSQYGGSGLGLFICKSKQCIYFSESFQADSHCPLEITEMLGGRIEVQSELGAGSGEFRQCMR
jgi:signal transduction histidine kinase